MKRAPLSPEQWAALDPLLDAALEICPDEREEWVQRTCADDPDMAAELMSLLAACDLTEDFLSEPAAATNFAGKRNNAAQMIRRRDFINQTASPVWPSPEFS